MSRKHSRTSIAYRSPKQSIEPATAAVSMPAAASSTPVEKPDADAKCFGDQIQPACRHAVGAVLVFLHLLEGAGRKIEVAHLLRLIREQDAFRPCREPIAETCDLGDGDGDRSWFSDRVRVSLGHVHSTCSGSGLASVVPTPASARSRGRERPYVARSREGCGGLSVGPGRHALAGSPADFGKLIADETEKW